MSRWEAVEETFSSLFAYFVQSPAQAAARAYGAVIGNQSRRQMIEEASEVFLRMHRAEQQFAGPLGRLLDHYSNGASRRNDVAHGYVMNIQVASQDLGHFLIPPFYNSRNTRAFVSQPISDNLTFSTAKYRYTSEDIARFTAMFNELQHEALKYFAQLAAAFPQAQTRVG